MRKELFLGFIFPAWMILFSFHTSAQLSGYYQESFEGTFPPTGWQTVDVLDPSYSWHQSPFTVYSGSYSVYIGSAVGQGEDWMILPQFSVAASDSFSFWLTAESLGFTDSTVILISNTTASLTAFTTVLATLSDGVNYPTMANLYQYYAYSLSAFAGQNIYVAFKNRNFEGDGVYVDLVSIGTPVATGLTTPSHAVLLLTYPNPFTGRVFIDVPCERDGFMGITIADAFGNEIASLDQGVLAHGTWHFQWEAAAFPAGVYFCKVVSKDKTTMRRLIKLH